MRAKQNVFTNSISCLIYPYLRRQLTSQLKKNSILSHSNQQKTNIFNVGKDKLTSDFRKVEEKIAGSIENVINFMAHNWCLPSLTLLFCSISGYFNTYRSVTLNCQQFVIFLLRRQDPGYRNAIISFLSPSKFLTLPCQWMLLNCSYDYYPYIHSCTWCVCRLCFFMVDSYV